jgi:hypothetical protein
LQDPPKFTQIGIFGLKTNHLATLTESMAVRFLHLDVISVEPFKSRATSARCYDLKKNIFAQKWAF